ncbi:uncharacterized protein LOC116025905 isoform X3 [Ipomoea triloba]|uniref:uncharacterized protein LOC116025905 isoform X3 n=1 Tax=Ipomoea triloba TaxID=35885 RepID=UPI00125D4129|nr:uncharacterized protein LOC116025905 isoform X3 [Ipomoea triloba]
MAGGVGEDTQNMLHLREESTIKKKKKMARVDANCNGLRLSNGSELVGITTRKQSQWCLSKYVLNVTVSRFRLMK